MSWWFGSMVLPGGVAGSGIRRLRQAVNGWSGRVVESLSGRVEWSSGRAQVE